MVQYSVLINGASVIPVSINVKRYLDPKPNEYSIELREMSAYSSVTFGQSVGIYRDNQLIFYGLVENIEKKLDTDGELLTLSGRDVTGYKLASTLFKKIGPFPVAVDSFASVTVNSFTTAATLTISANNPNELIYTVITMDSPVPNTKGVLSLVSSIAFTRRAQFEDANQTHTEIWTATPTDVGNYTITVNLISACNNWGIMALSLFNTDPSVTFENVNTITTTGSGASAIVQYTPVNYNDLVLSTLTVGGTINFASTTGTLIGSFSV